MPAKKEKFTASNEFETACVAVAAKYQGKPKTFGFDIGLIAMIMAALMPLLQNCLKSNTPEGVAAAAKRPRLLHRAVVYQQCLNATHSLSDAMKLASAVFGAAKEASEEEIVGCCASVSGLDANGGTLPE